MSKKLFIFLLFLLPITCHARVPLTSLEKFADSENNVPVSARAQIVVPFGLVSQSIAYALPVEAGTGILLPVPIYYSKKSRPKLRVGGIYSIRGSIATVRDQKVLKISDAKSFTFERDQALPHQPVLTVAEITDQYDGAWITMQGRILKINAKSYSIGDETSRVLVSGKLSRPAPAKKALVQATGFLQFKSLNPTLTVVQADDFSIIAEAVATSPTSTTPIAAASPEADSSVRWWYIATVPIAAGAGWLLKRFVVEKV